MQQWAICLQKLIQLIVHDFHFSIHLADPIIRLLEFATQLLHYLAGWGTYFEPTFFMVERNSFLWLKKGTNKVAKEIGSTKAALLSRRIPSSLFFLPQTESCSSTPWKLRWKRRSFSWWRNFNKIRAEVKKERKEFAGKAWDMLSKAALLSGAADLFGYLAGTLFQLQKMNFALPSKASAQNMCPIHQPARSWRWMIGPARCMLKWKPCTVSWISFCRQLVAVAWSLPEGRITPWNDSHCCI